MADNSLSRSQQLLADMDAKYGKTFELRTCRTGGSASRSAGSTTCGKEAWRNA